MSNPLRCISRPLDPGAYWVVGDTAFYLQLTLNFPFASHPPSIVARKLLEPSMVAYVNGRPGLLNRKVEH